MVTQRGATSGERAQRVHGGGPKATPSVLVPQCCEPGAVRLLEVQTTGLLLFNFFPIYFYDKLLALNTDLSLTKNGVNP